MASCGRCPCRAFIWFVWVLHVIICIVYAALALYTYHNMDKLLSDVKSDGDRNIKPFKHGILAALLLGFLLVILWIIFSFFVLLGRYFSEVSMVYGFMLGWGGGLAMFELLAGLVVQNAEELAKQAKDVGRWSDRDLQGYYASFAFRFEEQLHKPHLNQPVGCQCWQGHRGLRR
ncbi:hypothetical protein DUNSADRAFT_15786 [Dunaliella salina]|uniref:Uncharacterized protein n=1 Tax=Dunaliella salina TaxID=3046 RepID=A0ABQ7H1G1_DUNSA|nr:hypothetical protein DUNSADRAFT_15786 [Dunaliella salina]|eukprot:KAF5840691.1 hypothetical protein DUNSADRAFT_15786 [Dunaliella salina]